MAPDGKAADDVYAVLRKAIVKTGKVALTRVVISQRERTIAIRPMAGGLVAQTLNEDRDLNSAAEVFRDIEKTEVDPEMVQLAVQLIDRQVGRYNPSDLEDRYETRLRAMLDAKLAGAKLEDDTPPAPSPSNVIDLMAALKKSLGATPDARVAPAKKARKRKRQRPEEARRQPAFKLPIEGGKKKAVKAEAVVEAPAPAPVARARRKA